MSGTGKRMSLVGKLLRRMLGRSEAMPALVLSVEQLANSKRHEQQRIASLTEYLLKKVEDRDWHAVADAAMDIREAEAVLFYLKEKENATKEGK